MASEIDPTIIDIARRYANVLRENNVPFESVWLFGSAVKNQNAPDSDIDIAIVMKDVAVKFFKEVELMKYRRKIDSRIEPHILTLDEMDSSFSLEIMRTGLKVA
jgi:predicted nucleotidyltransferase